MRTRENAGSVRRSVAVIIVVHCVQHKLNNAVHLERQPSEQTQNEMQWEMYELPQSNKL